MRADQLDGSTTPASAGNGYARGIRPASLDVGGTVGLDRTHVDGSRTGSERRWLVQLDGFDHFRWPNRYFAKQGLFSLVAAHAVVVQPSPR